MPEEQTFVARYKVDGFPRQGDTLVFDYKGNEIECKVEKNVSLTTDLVKALQNMGVEVIIRADSWADPTEGWQAEAWEVYQKAKVKGSEGQMRWFGGWKEPVIETPTSLKQSEHIRRRKILEEFFQEQELDFTVECATLHSDASCRLATEEEEHVRTN